MNRKGRVLNIDTQDVQDKTGQNEGKTGFTPALVFILFILYIDVPVRG